MFAPGAGRHAVHPRDHRHRQRHELADQRIVALLHRLAEIDRLARRHGAVVEILPGAEAAARAGQDQAARVAEVRERVGDLLVHLDGEAVEPVRAVEREAGDAGLELEVDGFVSMTRAVTPPLPGGEGIEGRGLAFVAASRPPYPLTLPSPHRGEGMLERPMTADPDTLADSIARAMLAAEGTGPAWGIEIEEAREGYARIRMTLRADMLNGHGIAHGGMVFALADTAFAYACNSRNVTTVAAQASIVFLDAAKEGEVLIAEAREDALVGRSGVHHVSVRTADGRAIAEFQGFCRTVGGPVVESDE